MSVVPSASCLAHVYSNIANDLVSPESRFIVEELKQEFSSGNMAWHAVSRYFEWPATFLLLLELRSLSNKMPAEAGPYE